MKQIKAEDLLEHQALPYTIYDENGEKILEAGKILTPKKLLQLKYFPTIYIKEDEIQQKNSPTPPTEEKYPQKEKKITENEYWEQFFQENNQINKTSIIESRKQLHVKEAYQEAIGSYILHNITTQKIFTEASDRIMETILPIVDQMMYRTQVQLLGDYYQTHSINVAILSIVLASKLKLRDVAINDVALAALLHDIGKTQIDKNILVKQNLSQKEQKILQLHPQLGYKILKQDFAFPENICRAVLEHHENHDGSGYPFGISDNQISLFSQIINICDYYDNLVAGKIRNDIKNAKDALKIILEIGSKHFCSQVLYSFINMSSYNDTILFKDLE